MALDKFVRLKELVNKAKTLMMPMKRTLMAMMISIKVKPFALNFFCNGNLPGSFIDRNKLVFVVGI